MVAISRLVRVGRFDNEDDLDRDLDALVRTYGARGIEEIATAAFDDASGSKTGYFSSVSDYFTATEAQYSGVHSPDGAVHFGLDWDGRFRRDGFYEHARIVEDMLRRRGARDCLEIGSGKGINSIYLARRNPSVSFTGVDLTPLHVRIASERGKGLGNLRFVESDFHDLARYEDASFDVVFDVEAGCYADTPEKLEALLLELRRVLRPGGLCVVFGYYRSNEFERRSRKARLTTELVERAWLVARFHAEGDWDEAVRRAGFTVADDRDLRAAAMPSVVRLYRQARSFYLLMASPAKPVLSMLVRPSTHNAISALMLPYAYGLDALQYRLGVLHTT